MEQPLSSRPVLRLALVAAAALASLAGTGVVLSRQAAPAPPASQPMGGLHGTPSLSSQALQLAQEGKHLEAARLYERAATAEPDDALHLLASAGWGYLDAIDYAAA